MAEGSPSDQSNDLMPQYGTERTSSNVRSSVATEESGQGADGPVLVANMTPKPTQAEAYFTEGQLGAGSLIAADHRSALTDSIGDEQSEPYICRLPFHDRISRTELTQAPEIPPTGGETKGVAAPSFVTLQPIRGDAVESPR